MNEAKVTYGDPSNISMFEENGNSDIVLENGKLLSKEPYAEELLKLYNESFSKIPSNPDINIGDTITGKIAKISDSDILIDFRGKEFAYVSINKDKLNPDSYKLGEEISALVVDNNGYLKASIVEQVKASLYSEMKGYGNKTIYDAEVVDLTQNGFILNIEGVKVFMPGSLGGINMLTDFKSLVGKTIKVMPIKNENRYSKHKDQLIVSHREYLQTLIPSELEKLEIGAVYTGTVTGTKDYGIFVEFNNVLTGMIYKDSFDDGLKELFDKKEVQAGREIDFYLKEIVNPKKIILSRYPLDEEEIAKAKQPVEEIKVGKVYNGKVVKTVKYGIFVKLNKSETGLVHISKLDEDARFPFGTKINVKVLSSKDGKYDLELV